MVTISLTILESLRFICFFLVCYYFCKEATNILPYSKRWVIFLKVFLIANLIWILASLGYLEYKIGILEIYPEQLCSTPMFMFLRSGGEFVTLIFVIIGVIITVQHKKINRSTEFERTSRRKAEKNAIFNMW